jgi:uncharacterized protein YaeQ
LPAFVCFQDAFWTRHSRIAAEDSAPPRVCVRNLQITCGINSESPVGDPTTGVNCYIAKCLLSQRISCVQLFPHFNNVQQTQGQLGYHLQIVAARWQPAVKYTFNIQVNDNKGEHNEKLVIGAFENESGTHIALKLLAYLLFINQRPQIDQDAGWHFVPDLVARDAAGAITLWIDCGRLSMKKVDTIAMKARDTIDFYVFRKTENDMQHFYRSIADKVKHLQNVKGISFDEGFIEGIGGCIDRTNSIEGYVGEDMVNLTVVNSFGTHEAYSSVHRVEPDSQ